MPRKPPAPRDPIDVIDDLNAQLAKIDRDWLAFLVAFNHGPIDDATRAHLTPFIAVLGETIRVARED